MATKYPILCPHCKKGYMKFEWHQLFLKADYFWVCEYCRFTLDKDFDNPSKR